MKANKSTQLFERKVSGDVFYILYNLYK